MRKGLFVATIAVLMVTGCFSPTSTADKRLKAVAEAKAQEAKNQERQDGKTAALVHGTGLALGKVGDTNPAVKLAKNLNRRAGLIAGEPSYDDALKMASIVEDGTSEDSTRVALAERRLAEMDEVVVGLQSKLVALEAKTAKVEEKRDETFKDFAGELGTWRGIKRLLFFGGLTLVLFFVGPIVLGVLGTAFPAISPITSIASKGMAGVLNSVVRVVPSVAQDAGVVAREQLERTRAAAADMSEAIAKLKEENRDAFKASVAPVLRERELARMGTALDTTGVIAEVRRPRV